MLIDLPGFGRSTAPDTWSFSMEDHAGIVAEVLDKLALGKAELIGHSMGGSIAIALAT
jgi:pimeloyl-ACP methyl ester carboxylesterase